MPTYPLTLPFAPRHVDWEQHNSVGATESEFTRQQQVQAHDGDLWIAEFLYPPMIRADAAQLETALLSLRGSYGTFYLGPTGYEKTPQGVATGTPLVDGAGQTGYFLATKGWTAGVTGILKAGDWISFAGYLHKVGADANSNGAGLATLELTTRLRVATTADSAITVSSPMGIFRLIEPSVRFSVNEAQHHETRFRAREKT